MTVLVKFVLAALLLSSSANGAESAPRGAAPHYTLVPSWPAGLLGLNISEVTAAAVTLNPSTLATEVVVVQRGAAEPFFLTCDALSGALLRKWSGGAGAVKSPHGAVTTADQLQVWVADIAGDAVSLFDASLGRKLASIGVAGNGLAPVGFSAVADVAVARGGDLLTADGDGGSNSRVLRLRLNASAPGGATVVFAVGRNGSAVGEFQSPHGIAYQAATETIWVADRGNLRLQALDAATGAVRGVWTGAACFAGGAPWGVRLDEARQLMVVADGLNGNVFVLNLRDAGSGSGAAPLGACSAATLLQTIPVGLSSKPHELALDPSNCDLYVADVGTPPAVHKYVLA